MTPLPTRANAKRAREQSARRARVQIRAYLAALPAGARSAVRKLCAVIRAAAPSATEAFSYGMSGCRLEGQGLVLYAGWKGHTSLYPLTAAMRRAAATQLKQYDTSKGTVRFPLTQPVPVGLVRQLLRARIAEVRGRGKR